MAQATDATAFPSGPETIAETEHQQDGDTHMTEVAAEGNEAAFTANSETIANDQRPDHSPMSEADSSRHQPSHVQRPSLNTQQRSPSQNMSSASIATMNGTHEPALTPIPQFQPNTSTTHEPPPHLAQQAQSYAVPNSAFQSPQATAPQTTTTSIPIKPETSSTARPNTPTAPDTKPTTNGTIPLSHIIPPSQPHGSPARVYLNNRVTPVLVEGLKYLAKNEPERPLAWLSEFLRGRSEVLEGGNGEGLDG